MATLCRNCGSQKLNTFCDLQSAPASNAYLTKDDLSKPEMWYPLRIDVCQTCWLVQTQDFFSPEELFTSDYAYFSSYSTIWLEHARIFAEDSIRKYGLSKDSFVIEIASNDGYLLKNFKDVGIPCLGIEPTSNTATSSRQEGIETLEEFFNIEIAKRVVIDKGHADFVIANNVLAHVPDPKNFIKGIKLILSDEGVASLEFHYLVNLVEQKQFDTIYHEHYSYLSLTSTLSIFEDTGLRIFDIENIPTHGGSLRIWVCHKKSRRVTTKKVEEFLHFEDDLGIRKREYYENFSESIINIKFELLNFLIMARKQNKLVAAYGAAAKGNTLLNYCGIHQELVNFVVDKNPEKVGKFMPGSRIPIVDENWIHTHKPDFIIILPWNLRLEIENQLSYVRQWGCTFVVSIPELQVY
jgi:SAM-dependent methyltransferase